MSKPTSIVSRSAQAIQRALGCLLSLAVGLIASGLLLASFGEPPRSVQAASPARPLSNNITVTVSIQAAIDAANPGDNVIIPAGHYTESLTLSKTVSLRGALSSTTIIHALSGQRVLTVTGAGINNSTVISGLTFRDGNTSDFFGGGAIRIEGFAQPLLQNLIITNNQSTVGGGGGMSTELGSPLRLINVSFYSNTTPYYGGALYALDAVSVDGGVFRGNRCTGPSCNGGGLGMGAVFPVSLNSVQFITNSAAGNGGGAFVGGLLDVRDGLFLDNAAGGTGGGLWAAATVAITGTRLISNVAVGFGGGVSLLGGGRVTDGLFQGNRCTAVDCSGGGLYVTSSSLDLIDTDFISNTADGYGGGGLLTGSPTTIQGGLFKGNASLTAMYSTYTLGGGGALALSTLSLTGTQFIANQTAGYGGGLLQEIGAGRVVNALFAGNSSAAGGHALALDTFQNMAASLILLHATVVAPAGSPSTGAAITAISGTLAVTNTIIASYTVGISRTTTAVVSEDYNLYSSVAAPTSGGVTSGGHSIVGNPFFRNPAAGDYHLGVGSNALDGVPSAGVPIDFEGDSRPIGSRPDIGFDEARVVSLALTKSDGQSSAATGASLVYTIRIDNNGPYPAAGVIVTDSLPAGLLPGPWSCLASAGSSCPASGSGSINATVTIANGSFVQFTLHATVANNASGIITNTVSVITPAALVNVNAAFSSASDATIVSGALHKLYLPLLHR